MKSLHVLFGLLSLTGLAALGIACDDDPSGGGGTSSSSSSGGVGDGGTFDGNAFLPDGGDAGGCPPAPITVLDAKARKLSLAGDELVFLDRDGGGPFYPGAAADSKNYSIRKIKVDGTGDTVLYTPTSLHQLNDVRVFNNTIYFLESERLPNGSEATRIFSMPLTGGTPQLIVYHADPETIGDNDRLDAIVGADAASLYVVRGLTTSASLFRVTIAGGAETALLRGGISSSPQLVGDSLYVRSSALVVVGNSGMYGIGKIPAAAVATLPAPTQVGTAACKGDLIAGDFGLLCTGALEAEDGSILSKWALDGTGHTAIFDNTADKSNREIKIGPVLDGFAYVGPEGSNTSVKGFIAKVPLAGGAATSIACGRAEIPRRGDFESGSNTAFVAELDMVATATDLIWVENTKVSNEDEKSHIFRAPR